MSTTYMLELIPTLLVSKIIQSDLPRDNVSPLWPHEGWFLALLYSQNDFRRQSMNNCSLWVFDSLVVSLFRTQPVVFARQSNWDQCPLLMCAKSLWKEISFAIEPPQVQESPQEKQGSIKTDDMGKTGQSQTRNRWISAKGVNLGLIVPYLGEQ